MQTYTLAICENELIQAKFIQKILADYAAERGIQFHLPIFESAEAFLFEYAENKAVDLLFLDIQMEELDGVALAEKIRETVDQLKIVFITGMTERIGEGYRVSASDFLIKPVKKDQLYAVLDRVLTTIPKEEAVIILPIEDEQVKLPLSSLICAEIVGKELVITTTTSTYRLKTSMQDFMKQLDNKQFIQTNRNWLINCQHIECVKKSEVIMANELVIPISRRNSKDVAQAFISYFRKDAQ